METAALIILTLNFLFVALLPRIFFRNDGKFTPMWFVTASPWGIAPIIFIAMYFGILDPIINTSTLLYAGMSMVGVSLCALSILIISMTIGTHRVPLALWHQDKNNDKPQSIVTWGSYKYMRHPFYSAFIVSFTACVLIAPHWSIITLAFYTYFMLNYTAAKEEKRLSQEEGNFGIEYTEYMKHTGRFFPRISRRDNKLQLQENQ